MKQHWVMLSTMTLAAGLGGCSAGAGAAAPKAAALPDGDQYCSGWALRDMKHWCVDPMSLEQASHRGSYTRMTARGGRVVRVEYHNGAGGYWSDGGGDVGFNVEYDAQGFTHKWFDAWGTTTTVSRYAGLRMTRLTAWGKPKRDRAEDGYQYVYTLDQRGFTAISKVVDEAGRPAVIGGIHETRFVRDEAGHQLETSFFDASGAPSTNQTGVHRMRERPGKLGCVEQWEHFDASGRPYGGAMGVSRGVRTCDGHGNMLTMRWFGPDGAPALNRQGIHGWDDTLDAHGARVLHVTVGLDGKPAPVNGHESILRERRDARGYVVEVSYLGAGREPVVMPDGYSGFRRTLLENGEPVKVVYVDANGRPVATRSGYAQWVAQYRKDGRMLSAQYLDASGRPGQGREGEAAIAHEYDARAMLSASTYLDPEGRPALVRRGYAQVRYVRDEEGRITSRNHFDAEGKPVKVASARVMWFSYTGSEAEKPAAISREEAGRRAAEALRRLGAGEPWLKVAKLLSESTDEQAIFGGQSFWYEPLWPAVSRLQPGDPPVLLDTPRGFAVIDHKE